MGAAILIELGGGAEWKDHVTLPMGELPLNTFDPMAAAPQDGTILVTGFGPFYGHSVNASWVAVQELARLTVHNPDGTHCKLDIREIPVEYEVVATEVPKLWRDVNPRFCVHVGVSPYDCVMIEQVAQNSTYHLEDVKGRYPSAGRCVQDGPSHIRTQVDVQRVVTQVMTTQSKVKVSASNDAGRYLYDFIYYTSLHCGDAPALFIHVPPLNKPYSSAKISRATGRNKAQVLVEVCQGCARKVAPYERPLLLWAQWAGTRNRCRLH